MEIHDSPEEAAFRSRVRAWFKEHCTPLNGSLQTLTFSVGEPAEIEQAKRLQASLAAAGLAGLQWPKEHGGQEAPLMHQVIFGEEASRFDLPTVVLDIGLALAAPTIIAHGTAEQKARFLPPILEGREIWCQMFSEPDAGSDLASIRTRAVRDGDEWVVDGQKVWSSGAHYSDWGIMPARTDPTAPKHRGLTYFLVDMRTPGVEVRPLRQMTGESHFNEVFLDGARLPADSVLGEVGGGWGVTQTTLMSERMKVMDIELDLHSLVKLAGDVATSSRLVTQDPVIRQRLADVHMRATILRLIGSRMLTALVMGREPGPEGSIAKLAIAQLLKRASELALTIEGPGGMLEGQQELSSAWHELFLVSPAMRILGGTDEIQRNIIGERVLGLPREEDPWRKRPFEDQPRAVG